MTCPGVPVSSREVEELEGAVGQQVQRTGWLEARRSSGRVHFLELRTGTLTLPVVVASDAVDAETFERCRRLTRESCVSVEGELRRDERSPIGFELAARSVRLVAEADEWPLSGVDVDEELRVAQRHLYLRGRRMRSLLLVRAALSRAIRDWLDAQGFVAVDAPIFTPNVVEEKGSLFETAQLSTMSYLSQSGQLYNEAAAMALGRVYSFGPTFRAERAPTRRHLSEFWMVEPEMAFVDLDGMMALAESFVRDVVLSVAESCAEDLRRLGRDPADFDALRQPFERISYERAVELARAAGVDVRLGEDLSHHAERAIMQDRSVPVFVTGYPSAVKPFYMERDSADPERVVCADLLAPEGYGEILGGGQRERDGAALLQRLEAEGLPVDRFQWYLDLRRYGSAPHSGFGLGLERTLAWIARLDGMDEAIAFPRLPTRSSP